ncbi:MAG: VWA domain-containing protein [Candidatus Methanoperedens sp.]|nr:VWA domain-containing protein [Candidatus Methanoperedens sp.]
MALTIPQFENPYVLLLISPLILVGLYYIRKGVSKWIIFSRIIILSLLIIALASPYSLGITTVRDDAPRITVISDNTFSMDLFNKDTGKKIFDALQPRTPTKFREFAGIKSPIGDEVIGASENNNLLLVTDGNANYGKDLFDAISFVSQTGTKVFAVKQKSIHNDASVEIVSAKNIIIGNENVFNVVVRQAGSYIVYKLDVDIDGKSVMSETFSQTEREKVIPVTGAFTSLGSHKMTATITPNGEDRFQQNNVFYKSIFVVPKPKLLAVTSDTGSPLYKIINSLYEVTTVDSLPVDLSPYKSVIIDNKGASELNADTLRNYVGNGGGLVVVGGESSYDKGLYNNSPVEAILPIISRAGEYTGGDVIVIVIDTSGSTRDFTYPDINANARYLVEKSEVGTRIGVVAFGGEIDQMDIRPLSSNSDKEKLNKEIEKFYPEYGVTNLNDALNIADKMLDTESATKTIIIISDGQIIPGLDEKEKRDKYLLDLFDFTEELHKKNIQFKLVQVVYCTDSCIGDVRKPNPAYQNLAEKAGTDVEVLVTGERLNIQRTDETILPTPGTTPEITYEYPLVTLDMNHFITKYINISASITGYNDVTPKLGADRLVTTSRGKPVLTTWGFGLGRVVSFTTDNGGGETLWASEVYSGENSRLISSMINWAIGDPRPAEGDVIQAEDIWAGTSGRVIVTSDKQPPVVELDGAPLDLSRTGPTTYETTINLETGDFHDISGYGIAVNYPLEYREIGFNDKLVSVIESNGGSVYNEDEVQGLMFLDIKEKAVRTVNEPKSEKEPYLLAALVLFLAEVIIRRLKDYRKDRPVIEENPPRAVVETVMEQEAV